MPAMIADVVVPSTVAFPAGDPVTVKLVIALPPFEGAFQLTVANPAPPAAVTFEGAPGAATYLN